MSRQARVSGPRDARPLGPLDPRDHGWRTDLAELSLAPLIAVPHYAEPVVMQLSVTSAALLAAPRADAVAVSELLHGERFAVLDIHDGQAWGYGLHDRYLGYLPADALVPAAGADAAMLGPGDALLFADAGIKSAVKATLPAGARIAVADVDERFVRIVEGPYAGLFLHRRHLAGQDPDWVEIALGYVGAPYRWGGRTRAGVDCSGLVQMARMIAGLPTRRDSDMQAADAPLAVERADARRGDIAWWPGHIGILLDQDRLLHANAFWMRCVVEPLDDVIARIAAGGGSGQPVLRRWS